MSSAVDGLAGALRTEILDGARAGGEPLREQAIADAHGLARHTVRAALRLLAVEGFVCLAPNAGARVALLDAAAIADLSATRTLLEVGAIRLALELGAGRLPPSVHDAAATFAACCTAQPGGWGAVVVGHARFHEALVAAAGSPRLTRAHAALSNELALFLVQGRPHFSPAALAAEHVELVAALEREGVEALEAHLAASAAALLA